MRETLWHALLNRPIRREVPALDWDYTGKTVLVTGAGGFIGTGLARKIACGNALRLILLDLSERGLHETDTALSALAGRASHVAILGDIGDRALLAEIFDRHRPQVVFHAAALKHVPLMEANPIAVVRTNVLGTWTLLSAAVACGAQQFVMISTDKAVNPIGVMGAAKRAAELVLLRTSAERTRMKAIRLGNVLGSHGSVVPLFREQISSGGPLTVTHPDVSRYFLSLGEAVDLILAAGRLDASGVYIPGALEPPMRILDLAQRLIGNSGMERGNGIQVVFTGLRPGEKLAEHFVSSRESVEPADDGTLHRVTGPEIVTEQFDAALEELRDADRRRDVTALLKALCRIVPEYTPGKTLLNTDHVPAGIARL